MSEQQHDRAHAVRPMATKGEKRWTCEAQGCVFIGTRIEALGHAVAHQPTIRPKP